jgi:NAD+ synthase (glutamine-hydrolysing)
MKTKLVLHQTHHTLADFDGIFEYAAQHLKGEGLHLFPELYLCGYPLQDLVLQKAFIDQYQEHLSELENWAKSQSQAPWRALMGGLFYQMDPGSYPKKITNVIYEIIPGTGLKKLYTKRLLPNYDIFDEQKYFSPGHENAFYEFQGELFGLQICEDMWASSFHEIDPCVLMHQEVKQKNLKLAAVINLSASPFEVSKSPKRFERARQISLLFKCPFAYVNRVGGEDEVLFDGGSFVTEAGHLALELKTFARDCGEYHVSKNGDYSTEPVFVEENTWEGLFHPHLNMNHRPYQLSPWSERDCEVVLQALKFGLQEYATKSGFKKFLIALSGGMDSALVLAIAKLSLIPGQSVEAIYMPSIFSSPISTSLSEEMCRRLGIPMAYLPIKFMHATVKNTFTQTFSEPFLGLTDENIQSRLRGTLLYTRSNQTGAMVINTSNKSELAVGYSTQYGDSVGAISLLGDLYKSEVFTLARYLNAHYGNLIPEGIIDRGPSAELRDNQLDQDSLPPYERLDPILEGILSYRLGKKELLEAGFSEAEVTKVLHLYLKSEYKRAQFCPILKIKAKSFGFGYRMPMTKNLDYQLQK